MVMRLNRKKKSGLTLIEVLLSTVLLSVIFLAVSALFIANQRFYLTSSDKVMVSYELQYAMDHIYKSVMQGIGDKKNVSISVTDDPPEMNELQFSVRMIDVPENPDDFPTVSNYADDIETVYTITEEGKLSYTKTEIDSGSVLEQDLDMIPKVILLFSDDPDTGEKYSRFYTEDNVLKIKLTAEYTVARGTNDPERATLYTACYPRLETFQ